MLITPERFNEVNQDFFESLIENGIEENIHLDYKEQLGSNAEIAKDLSSFANNDGGIIIYGMREVNNKPTEIIPLNQPNLREKIDQIARNGIDPSLDIRILPVDVNIEGNEGQIFLIYIPRKYPILHQAVTRGKYYKRTEFTSSQMSNFEIETAFNLAYNYEKRINTLYQNILNDGEYLINIPSPTRMLIHMISIDALNPNESMDLEIIFNNFEDYLRPPGCTFGKKIERNLLGLLVSCGPEPYTDTYVGYVQLYRIGMIEAIDSSLLKPTTQLYGRSYTRPVKKLGMWYLEKNIIDSCENYLKTLEKVGVGLPIYLYLSFTHMKDYEISLIPYVDSFISKYSDMCKKDEILLPRIKIDSFGVDFEKKLKSSFDIFWNVFNQPGSRNYDKNGCFIHNLFKG
ncbi:MAG: helix-turn-helix domain-containing protein [Candidatus Hodarchaeota archaeon]